LSDTAASAGAAAAASAREAPAFPKPNRLPPFVMESRRETRPEYDVDRTLCPEVWEQELTRRKMRNEMIKDQLQAGRSVCYRSSGWSLYTRPPPSQAASARQGASGRHRVLRGPAWGPQGMWTWRRVVFRNFERRGAGERLVLKHSYGRLVEVLH
jgi:hypothetical protein